MRFRIGEWLYRVRVTEDALFDTDGIERAGLWSQSERTIWIAGKLPIECRLETLLHELAHAWRRHTGRPVDEESLCDQSATFTGTMSAQLERQGGIHALMRLGSDGVLASPAAGMATRIHGSQCGQCGESFGAHQVVTRAPEFDAELNAATVERRLYCEACHHVQWWKEMATPAGKPSGSVLAGPEFRRGDELAEFLRRWGRVAGVRMD